MTDSTRLCGKPVAWGAVSSDGGIVNMMRTRSAVAAYVVDGTPIVPLYRSPTLTDEERRWIQWAIEVSESLEECGGAGLEPGASAMPTMVLRGLLDRMK